jgi:hypothetical protein
LYLILAHCVCNPTVFALDIIEGSLYAAHLHISSNLLEKRQPSLNTSKTSRQSALQRNDCDNPITTAPSFVPKAKQTT